MAAVLGLAAGVLEEAAKGQLTITSLAEESRPPAAGADATRPINANGSLEAALARMDAAGVKVIRSAEPYPDAVLRALRARFPEGARPGG